ncbi:MAG: AI-2E family transporter [Clostridia bacterium]|nr:AI-2E family transporter [Clostridia bacterium]
MNNEKMPKNEKEKLLIAICTFGIIFLLLFAIVNFGTLSVWFSWIISVLNPVIIGFIIAYLCNPIYKWLNTKPLSRVKNGKIKKPIAIILTYLIILAVVAGLLLIIVPQVITAITDFTSKIDGYINTAVKWVNNIIQESGLFSSDSENALEFIDKNEIITNLTDFIKKSGDALEKFGDIVINYSSSIVTDTINTIMDIFLGLFISIYVLIFKDSIKNWFKRIMRVFMSRDKYNTFIRRVNHANGKFGNYLIGAITDSIIVAVEGFIIFSLFGIPYAPLVAVIVGITNIIPILGPFLGAIPSAFIIFIVDPGKLILFIILIIVIQQIDGNIVAPFILGSSLGLSSFGVIIAVTVMGGLWGVPGMFIGVPLFAFIADIIEESVNSRLKEIGDPEFPPKENEIDKNDQKSPIPGFVKKYALKAGKAVNNTANAAITKYKNNKKK